MLKQNIDKIKKYAKGTRIEHLAEMLNLDDFENFIYLSDKKPIISNIERVLRTYKEEISTKLRESILGFIDDITRFGNDAIKLKEAMGVALENSKKLNEEAEKADQMFTEYQERFSSETKDKIIH
jgi:hypothetical protein